MSIRIVPESERTPGVDQIEPVLLPQAGAPYGRRAARLRTLAEGHPMVDYLSWAADLADAQQAVSQAAPLPETEVMILADQVRGQSYAPLHSGHWQRSAHWQAQLDSLLDKVAPLPSMQSAPVRQALESLRTADGAQRDAWADALLAGLRGEEPGSVLPEAGAAQLLWGALSVYWRQLASSLPGAGVAELGEHRHLCPVCGHAPVGSVILDGSRAGLRYLQCSLCESQWHVVRTKCTNCDGTGALDYWCLEDAQAPVRAESCSDCDSYLKGFYLQADRALDPVADDLATLALDAEMDAKGLARSGVNPLMLP
ncbi:MAG: formate dehydrogenase accessory protein FdhE [Corticimicrobacter sp.]|uniref:formate dehydrogenase accessory protein FdhE n=1 Tax=Corticimicrobacter sp. TaxID=2678536 RepID=UPI0032DA8018